MSNTITLLPDESQFDSQQKETILESALRSGQSPDYGCDNGNCGHCKAKLIQGEIEAIRHFDYPLSAIEKTDGTFLMCSHRAKSDLIIEANIAHDHTDIPLQSTTAKIKKILISESGIMLIPLQTPRTRTLRFLAGQWIELKDGEIKLGRYHIGSCPCDDRNLLLHVPITQKINVESNNSTKSIAAEDYFKSGQQVDIHGPHGSFTLEEIETAPAFIIAEEHAFAPAKSLIEHAIALEYEQPILLTRYTNSAKPYLHNLCRCWNDALDDFNYELIHKKNSDSAIGSSSKERFQIDFLHDYPDAIAYIAGSDEFCDRWEKYFEDRHPEKICKFTRIDLS